MTSKSTNYEELVCWYDDMPIPGKITCSRDLKSFGTIVTVLKNSTVAERNADIRSQMKLAELADRFEALTDQALAEIVD